MTSSKHYIFILFVHLYYQLDPDHLTPSLLMVSYVWLIFYTAKNVYFEMVVVIL